MRSETDSVRAYLDELPAHRREAIEEVRRVILSRLPDGYRETMNWGMIAYEVPLEVYPETYNGEPLMYAALASQKKHMAVYLSGVYADEETRDRFEEAYRASGKRMDVGKSCVRFRSIDEVPLDVVGDAVGALSVDQFIEVYEKGRSKRRKGTMG